MPRQFVSVTVLMLTMGAAAAAQSEKAIVRPVEIDQVLVNPGMGIQTFQRFNGQALNPGLKWSEEGPTSKLPDESVRPNFPDSSIAYCRWFWSALEPEKGTYRWDIIDLALEEARAHHQTLAIRLMPYDREHALPEWYRNSGARRANKPTDEDGNTWQPDFSDALYLQYWGELVAAAGTRYDGHPYLDTVDISSVGYWGEGWSRYMPSFPHQKVLIDIWIEAFKRTPLLMNFDEEKALAYGTRQGAGWRLDCLGDMKGRVWEGRTSVWSHMLDFYPQQIVRAGIQDVWERSPVSLETCGTPGSWKQRGYDVDYILAQALRWHITSLNVKSTAIPAEWEKQFEEFQKKMGYRFLLRKLQYPKAVKAGSMMPVEMWWLNAGVAPVYRDYWLAVQISSPNGSAVIRTDADVRKWLPGDAVYESTIYVPEHLRPGAYRFRLAMLDPRTEQPAVRLAIEGRQADGWYDLGEITVE
ncbi:MAG TPA: DUF4832 domain-containing protein [Terriglobia bacterium]|nr:DUF4832 domain-containing protein [Terriglobia bacterium]